MGPKGKKIRVRGNLLRWGGQGGFFEEVTFKLEICRMTRGQPCKEHKRRGRASKTLKQERVGCIWGIKQD